MRERRETERMPEPEIKPAGFENSVFIADTSVQYFVDHRRKETFKRRSRDAESYLQAPESQTRSFGGSLIDATGAERLGDTTILGRRCIVLRRTRSDMTTTLAMWKGIVLREEVTNDKQQLRFILEATEITPGFDPDESAFATPTQYPVKER